MSSFRTLFRAAVMLATFGLLAKAWYHFGPTLGEIQAIGGRVVQVANEAWVNYWLPPGNRSPSSADQHLSSLDTPPAPFVPPTGPVAPTRLPTRMPPPDAAASVQPAGNMAVQTAPAELAPVETDRSSPTNWPGGILSSATLPNTNSPPADPLQAVLDRLTQVGVRDQELTAWGGRGELVRFTCRVPWGGSANYTRQFEAVATTPLAAVEQVAAEVEAWHSSR
jgi:hypothetical protein